jgi:hypothetical protein
MSRGGGRSPLGTACRCGHKMSWCRDEAGSIDQEMVYMSVRHNQASADSLPQCPTLPAGVVQVLLAPAACAVHCVLSLLLAAAAAALLTGARCCSCCCWRCALLLLTAAAAHICAAAAAATPPV